MSFEKRFDDLNDEQKLAVRTINGPLLVLAGPGTGKTELLSMRAAEILRQTDMLPNNILCLTFTDSGANNMRERLRQIIGEAAYKVAIHTFHSFGTEVISKNREYFFSGVDRKAADELGQHQIMRQLFEELAWDHPLATKNGEEFIYLKDTLSVISEFKQSGLSPDELRLIVSDNQRVMGQIVDDIAEVFASTISKATIEKFATLAQKSAGLTSDKLPTGITSYANTLALSIAHASQQAIESNSTKPITAWKNSWCKKDHQSKFVLKDAQSIDKLNASIDLYEKYAEHLAQKNLFDYDDMILSVLRACQNNFDLRANLQEQYQFIMVDEFQDTNLAQLRLLFEITGEGGEPNVMAVGDDDQAIFSFQGADNGNIQRFRTQYADPKIIVLTHNYRSNAEILTASRQVITQGEDRLENTIADLSKELTPHADSQGAMVELNQFTSPIEERAGVARQIAELIRDGVRPENIAVLARRHYELIDLLPHLAKEKISVNYERRDDVLEHELVKALELTARVVVAIANNDLEAANAKLPELVSHPALGFSTQDIWKLSLNAWRGRSLWLESMLANSTFENFANWLLEQSRNSRTTPLETQIDELTTKFHEYYFSTEKLDEHPDAYLSALESLRTLRDALRDYLDDQEPDLSNLIDFIDLYRSLGTRLVTVRQRAEHETGAIHLMSAHKAKGLEFPHVFVIGAIDGAWGEKVRSKSRLIRYPANLKLEPTGATYDERIRLFFVAMTRAKNTLHMSFSKTDIKGKDTLVASFLSTRSVYDSSLDVSIEKSTDLLKTDWQSRLTEPIGADLQTVLAPVLENYKLSATHLNNFLDVSRGGPANFLLSNLLRFPQAKSPSAGYGTAIHASLQFAHNSFRLDSSLPSMDEILSYFEKSLGDQHLSKTDFEDYNQKGKQTLNAFLDAKDGDFSASQLTELSFAGQEVVVGDARLTGVLDLSDIDKQAKTIFVTDYKTGKPSHDWKGKSDYEKIKLHKYRQQLMFYQILVENSRDYSDYNFTGGRLQFVEPEQQSGDILDLTDNFSSDELTEFKRLISIIWEKIINLDLPDISQYSEDYKGMIQFESDLLAT